MSLDTLIDTALEGQLKFVFVGGKGGVGKTTSSSAIASLLARVCKQSVLLVSTDPAHSLGDAWRMKFSNEPTCPDPIQLPNLEVMEIDPKESMEEELKKWAEYARDIYQPVGQGVDDNLLGQINSLQQWLSGIPGIDEATALSSAITYIESGRYDIIIFDTAPSGHTLKLLALPEILSKGLDKLQSWQSTFFSYWEALKGITAGDTAAVRRKSKAKQEIAERLTLYKQNIEKVAMMIQDQVRTRFVVVCIAEYLSVMESQRLLQELAKNHVLASHIIVNQLVVHDALTRDELVNLESLAEVGDFHINQILLQKTIHACRLATARKEIQTKYLEMLKSLDETKAILQGICEVPLLANEVTGKEAIHQFSQLLVKNPDSLRVFRRDTNAGNLGPLYHPVSNTVEPHSDWSPAIGDIVQVVDLEKSPQFNGLEGVIVSDMDATTGRYGVTVKYEEQKKILALQPKNLSFVRNGAPSLDFSNKKVKVNGNVEVHPDTTDGLAGANKKSTNGMDPFKKALQVLEEPEIKSMIDKNPRVRDAVNDVVQNPMNFMKYIGDPEISPLISKVMSKF